MSKENQTIQIAQPRLPYHPAVEKRFGIDKSGWKALVEAVFPNAQTAESVILALTYCKARDLDVFKRVVHIVPIWDKKQGRMVETVWPGIGELRTTAFRSNSYAGRDATSFGDNITHSWDTKDGPIEVNFPEWAQITVYRIVNNERVAFAGPTTYWLETYASVKDGSPNSMWRKRPRGQIDKCAEAAALRCAFPEGVGDQYTEADGPMVYQHGGSPILNYDEAKSQSDKTILKTMGSQVIDVDLSDKSDTGNSQTPDSSELPDDITEDMHKSQAPENPDDIPFG